MSSAKDDRLRKLLQSTELNKPGSSFTDEVMKEIQGEVVFNPLLKSILKNAPVENPKEGFTNEVMSHLEASDFKLSDVSIIGKKVWLTISGVVAFLVLIALFGRSESNYSVPSYFNEVGKLLHPILTLLNSIPSISFI